MTNFIDNIIIGTEGEDGYDKLIEEVVKRLAENDLYIKLEKYKWKVGEIGFLGVVIRPERIKIEKEKEKGILNWPTSKGVKDVQKFLGLANYYCWFIKDFAVRIEDNGLSFYFILFYFLVGFIIDHRMKKTKCDNVICHICHMLMWHDETT